MKTLLMLIFLVCVMSAYSQQEDNPLKLPDSSKSIHVKVWSKEDSIKYYKSPGTALSYSLVFPGLALGQLYNGNYTGWVLRTLISGVCVGAYFLGKDSNKEIGIDLLAGFVFAGNWITSIFDAHNDAVARNKKNKYGY